MALSIGIVGLPNVGKSTLFNALTDAGALVANYPFATIEPNTGVVPIPDPRLNKLAEIYKTQKIVPATVQFVDIAGLVAGASKGEGLGNQFLAHIRSVNAICHVVRAFADSDVTRTGSSDPKRDIEIINTELALADLTTVDRRLPQLQKEARVDPKLKIQANFLGQIKGILDAGKPLFTEVEVVNNELWGWLQKELQLLSAKRVIYVFNVDEKTLADESKKAELAKTVAPTKALFVCAKLESELTSLDETERIELLESYGQKESSLIQVIHTAYETLGLQSYLTAGEKEVRAWTIPVDSTAPQAAGVIHGDFERGFIAAQVINYNDLITAGSENTAKAAGKIRTEGKTYVMQPDDVVEFRFNV